MPYKKPKTDQEWERIRFKNSVGPAVGGIGHDVAVLVAAGIKPTKENITSIRKWYKEIYDIAEVLKAEITAIKPVDFEKAEKLGNKKKQELYNQDTQLEEINKETQQASEQLPVIELE